MYLMNILVPGMLYHGPVVYRVLTWADVRRPPTPCGSGCHKGKGEEFGGIKRNVDTETFGVVSIGGAIVHPR